MKINGNVLPVFASPDSQMQESQLTTYSQSSALIERCSQNELFQQLVEKLDKTGSTFENLQRHFSQLIDSSKYVSLRTFSTNSDEEYSDILMKKGDLVEKLASSIEDLSFPLEFPQYRIQCYQGLSLEFDKRYNETQEEHKNHKNNLTKCEVALQVLNSQSTAISNRLHRDNDLRDDQEIYKVKEQFNKAKAGLEKVLNALYSKRVIQEFTQAMGILTESYVSNIKNEEEQFVELSASTIKNVGIQCLLQEYVIIPHPRNPIMYRLCVEDD